MMRKNQAKDMVKASLWMPKTEYKRIAEMSGDMSINLFIMRLVRKGIEEENAQKVGVKA